MRNAENRARVICGMLHAEKYCGTKGKMRNVKMRNGNKIGKTNWRVTALKNINLLFSVAPITNRCTSL